MPTRPTGKITPPADGPLSAGHARSSGLGAVVTVARSSVGSVVELHDIAVSAGRRGRIPAADIPVSAKSVRTQLRLQAAAIARLKTTSGSPQAQLASALDRYVQLSAPLVSWNGRAKLGSTFFSRLQAADASWKAAMHAVGAIAHEQLLVKAPKLLLPA